MFKFFNADGDAGGSAASSEGSTEQKPAAAAALPEAIINKIKEDTLRVAREEAGKIAADAGTKAAREQADRVMRALGSEPDNDEAKSDALLKRLFTDPLGTLAGVSQHASEQTEARITARLEREAEQRRESAAASKEVLKDRPDIYTNDTAKELLGSFYDGVDPKLPEKEKLEIALRKYDKHMEAVGAPKVEERVKAASVSSHASASGGSSAPEKKPVKEAQAEAQRATQDEAVEAYKKKHGGRYPASWR